MWDIWEPLALRGTNWPGKNNGLLRVMCHDVATVSRRPTLITRCLLAAAVLAGAYSFSSLAKSYSGGGHSYSSHSSSFSSSSGGSHSFSSGSHSFSSGSSHSSSGSSSHSSGFSGSSGGGSHSFSSGGGGSSGFGSSHTSSSDSGKSFSPGGGKSYSSGSTWSDSTRHSYTSGKSYTSGAGHLFSSGSGPGLDSAPASTHSYRQSQPEPSSSAMSFDSAAAHARKEQASKEQFTHFKESQSPTPKATDFAGSRSASGVASTPSYRVTPPPLGTSRSYRQNVYIPDGRVLSTRPVRIYNVFNPYWSRPVVVYRDPYSSLFWWWLLDRSLDDRAYWTYHHRYDMDPARYQALVDSDQQLQARVADLEAQQSPRDPNYVPPTLDRDLMYSDQHVARVYSNRPTAFGAIAFWVLGVPTALAFTGFFIWLIWFKRWQTAT